MNVNALRQATYEDAKLALMELPGVGQRLRIAFSHIRWTRARRSPSTFMFGELRFGCMDWMKSRSMKMLASGLETVSANSRHGRNSTCFETRSTAGQTADDVFPFFARV